jgi:excisionase family DNA binding protein
MDPKPDPEYLTPREVAERLKLDPNTVRSLARSGLLPAIRVGGQYRIPRAAFEAWLHRASTSQAAPAAA